MEKEKAITAIIRREILDKPIVPKPTKDIVLCEKIFGDIIESANLLKNFQMRVGKTWECLASEVFGWEKVKGIDLVCNQRKIAIELKNADNTDNSSSRARNNQKLLCWRGYNLFYLCINNRTTKEDQNYTDNVTGITYLTGRYALELLFGNYVDFIVEEMQACCARHIILKNFLKEKR